MNTNTLQAVAENLIRRARNQGHVIDRDVREELVSAGLSDLLWKDVLALARPSLTFRNGQYFYTPPLSDRVMAEQANREAIRAAVLRLVEQERAAQERTERREQGRIDFIHPVQVLTEDNRTLTLLTRDLSATGIRLLSGQRLLGQKIHVLVPLSDGGTLDFYVRILWTCPVGDDLIENGGTFLSVTVV